MPNDQERTRFTPLVSEPPTRQSSSRQNRIGRTRRRDPAASDAGRRAGTVNRTRSQTRSMNAPAGRQNPQAGAYGSARGNQAASTVGRRSGRRIQKARKTPALFAFSNRGESNFNLMACTIVLMVFGAMMVTSSSYSYAYTMIGDSLYFFKRQMIWLIVGMIAMLLVMALARMDWIRKWSFVIYVASVFFCVLVLFIGNTVNGSTRWLGIGDIVTFQPSEFAKLAVVLYISNLVENHREDITKLRTFIFLLGVVALPAGLVAIENLTSGVIIAVIGVVIMYLGGVSYRHLLGALAVGLAFLALFLIAPRIIPALADYSYRLLRVQAWLDPFQYALDDGYQTVQSLYAVGSGGLFGRGLGQSIQKLGFIPEAYNDIIFAIICEELGLFGAAVVVILFSVFTWNGVKVSLNAPDRYTSYVSAGIVGQISLQAILNIAVNTNLIPTTGVSLPFISYGGSSMLFLMASVGLVLNISSYSKQDVKA
ncbi:MAG: FtsW/RodA/SpoVE family cell cycle protein [Firmicutes bacterium]|nr:FtsW/RodA/SpoVE family cell cycle protein [Bacillota bacterium]